MANDKLVDVRSLGGKARWKGVSKQDRSAIMAKVAGLIDSDSAHKRAVQGWVNRSRVRLAKYRGKVHGGTDGVTLCGKAGRVGEPVECRLCLRIMRNNEPKPVEPKKRGRPRNA
jgi:hypothetical protein